MINKTTLRILLLGSPATFVNDQPLQIQRRLLRWMLFYLACQKELVGRSDLILLFWPDEPEEDARRHLREMLSKLRAQLPDPNMIVTEQDQVGLDPNSVYSDVLEFQSLYAQTARACTTTAASSPLPLAIQQRVRRAVRLWRSTRLMAGAALPESETLNDWLLSTSQQLEAQRLRLLERLVDHDLASGDVDSALNGLRNALEGDETNETLQYQMLYLLHKHDRYSEALNYCTYLQEIFRREGFSELPPALLSLSRQIREEAASPITENDQSAWPALAEMQVPFVGQQSLLQELQFAARRGSPVILFGEAGSGKSRLVRELFFSLKPAPRLLLAPAHRMEPSLPFQPIIDMLRRDIRAEEWQKLDLAWVAPLALLLPELTIMREGIQRPQVTPEQEHSLVFEALRQLLLFISKKQRFLLILDNAQWSDVESLSALAYLADRGLFDNNGALILAARPEEMPPHLKNFLNRPRDRFTFQRLSMFPLNAEEISTLARYVLGDSLNPNLIPRLETETGGNPLFLLETLRLVLDYSFDVQHGKAIDHLPLSSRIHTFIRERLQHLTPNDAQVLSTAAVAGSHFSIDLLESTCQLPAEQTVQSLESLVQLNLIQADMRDQLSGGYRFVHEQIREALLLDLSPARKRLFHLRIARALDQKHQGQSSEVEAVLAEHYEEAGELNAAFLHWLKAGQYARQRYAKETAFHAYRQAERILQRLGQQAPDSIIYQLYGEWAHLAYDLGDPRSMEEAYNILLEFGLQRQNALLTGSAFNGLAQVAEMHMRPIEGLAYLEKALIHLERAGNFYEQISALNRQGQFHLQMGKYKQAYFSFEQANILAESSKEMAVIEARAHAEFSLAVCLMLDGWPLRALEMIQRSIQDSNQVFAHTITIRATSMMSLIQCYLGSYSAAQTTALQATQMADTLNSPLINGEVRGSLAQACLALGDLDGCWNHAQAALQIAQQYPYSYLGEGMNVLLGRLFFFLSDTEKAIMAHQTGGKTGLDNFQSLQNNIFLARIQSLQGETQPALTAIQQIIDHTRKNGIMLFHLDAMLVKAHLLMDANLPDEAQPLLDFAAAEAQTRCLPETHIRALLAQARKANNAGQPELAAQMANTAVEEAVSISNPLLQAEGYSLLLSAARPNQREELVNIQKQLRVLLDGLIQQTRTAEIKQALLTLQENVDRSF